MTTRLVLAIAITVSALVGGTAVTALENAPRPIRAITSKPQYAHSTWGLMVVDVATGAVLLGEDAEKMFVPGSIFKVYSTAAVLDVYGPSYRFETPVYRRGNVSGETLTGDLVLVASGDFSFGLRERPDGTLAFNSAPELDHNYADTGLPGAALVPSSRPLAGVDDLAAQVRAAGIREVRGDVVVDDRLFIAYAGWSDGLISPIWVNENVIDITTTPTAAGQPAAVDWRPRTAAYRVVSEVTTVANDPQPLIVDSPSRGVIRIRGQVAAGGAPVVSIFQVEDPAAFARTAFIEALGRAGVTVTATATGANPSGLLAAGGGYPATDLVARRVSLPMSEYTKVILKTSYNRGADLMVCLLAVRSGGRDCAAGLTRELEVVTRLGASRDSTIIFDGAGSDERERTSPADMVRVLRAIAGAPWGPAFQHGLAVLGVDGDIATLQRGTSAAGRARLKTGARVAMTPNGAQGIATALTMAGYADTASGRRVAFAVFLRDRPITGVADIFATREDQSALVAAIQGSF